MKECTLCHTDRDIVHFAKDKRIKSGYRSGCAFCCSEYKYKKRYNISHAEYIQMLQLQNNKCQICNKLDIDCQYKKLNIDHCHKTGKVRGLLCNACNQAIGYLKDNSELARRAAIYLDYYLDPNKEQNGQD